MSSTLEYERSILRVIFFSLYEDCAMSPIQEKILEQMKIWVNHLLFSGRQVHMADPIYKVLEVQRRIVSRPQKREDLSSLATRVNLSPSWFSFKFREISGVPLKKFILRKKLCYSLWQIVSTRKPIKRIAIEIGYKPLSFTKRFRALFGVAPYTIRKKLSSFLT